MCGAFFAVFGHLRRHNNLLPHYSPLYYFPLLPIPFTTYSLLLSPYYLLPLLLTPLLLSPYYLFPLLLTPYHLPPYYSPSTPLATLDRKADDTIPVGIAYS